MIDRVLADVVLVTHAAFVVFVAVGGFFVLRWGKIAWLHIPAALWGVIVEYSGASCPLTPLELELRRRSGAAGYPGGFIDHYVLAVLYPQALTRRTQVVLGTLVLAVNAAIYWRVAARRRSPS